VWFAIFIPRFKSKLTNTKTVTFEVSKRRRNGNFNRSDELDDRTMKTKRNTQSIEEQV